MNHVRRALLRVKRVGAGGVAVTVLLLAFTVLVLVPFIWLIMMSFRTTGEILANPYGVPRNLYFANYVRLLTDPSIAFMRYFWNSTVVTVASLALTVILSSFGGYGFARRRFSFRGRKKVFTLLLLSLMLPPQAMYIPQFTMMARFGPLNTRFALILLYTAYAITISTFLLKTYFAQLPGELEESARMDGAGDLLIFVRIMLPLARPVIATVILINFREFWNELLIALTMITRPALRTLPLAMMNFVGENASNYALAATALVVGMMPLLIAYLFLAERFVEGITAGALKG